jgi:hypothetical protein
MPGVWDKEMRTGHPWQGTLHGTKAHVKRIPARIYHEDSAIKDQRVKSRLLARVQDPGALALQTACATLQDWDSVQRVRVAMRNLASYS